MEKSHAANANHFADAAAERPGNSGKPAGATGNATVRIDPDGARVRLGTLTGT